MKGTIRNVLDSSDILSIFNLYKELPNEVLIDGELQNRHNVSNSLGIFLLSSFTKEEFESFNNKILTSIEQKEGVELEVVYSRVLKYTAGCYIKKHYDIKTPQTESGLSIIIQLSDQEDFKGGKAMIEDEEIKLTPGDLVYYNYNYEHEVTKVFSGTRYVVNLRVKVKKSNTLI